MFIVYCILTFYFSLFVHEAGHAFFGWRGGYRITSFGLGTGKPLLVHNWRGIRVFLCRNFGNGLTFAVCPQLLPARNQRLLFLAGGLIANGAVMVAGLALAFLFPDESELGFAIVAVNGSLLINAFPFQAKMEKILVNSDGAQMLALLRGQQNDALPGMVIRHTATVIPLLTVIGDANSLYEYLIAEANAYAQCGDKQTATRLYEHALGLPMPAWAFRRAHALLVESTLASLRGEEQARSAALDRAAQQFGDLDNEVGAWLTGVSQAEILLKSQPDAACQALTRLADAPVVRRHKTLQRHIELLQLQAAVEVGSEDISRLFSAYEATRKRGSSTVGEANVCGAMAQWAERNGNWQKAETYRRRALQAVITIYRACPDVKIRAAFAESQSDFIAAMQNCLRHTGKTEEAEKLSGAFSDIDIATRHQTENEARRKQAAMRQNRWLDGVSGIIFLAGIAYGQIGADRAAQDRQRVIEHGNCLLLVFLAGLTGGFAVILYSLRRVLPNFQQHGGKPSLALSLAPWAIYLLFHVFV